MRRVLVASALAATMAAPCAHAALVISKKPTRNMTCDRGTCSATAADAVLNVKDLRTLLRISDLTLIAGSGALDIAFDAPFSWSSARLLTLNADRSILVRQPIAVQGKGALDVEFERATAGSFAMVNRGRIDFWDLKSPLTINFQQYPLVRDIADIAHYVGGAGFVNLALAKDIDAKRDGTYTSAPVAAYFSGTLEGLGHTISNLKIKDVTTSHHDGLISDSYGGTFRNIGLTNATISGADDSSVGGFTGGGNAHFDHAFVTGTISAGQYTSVGGLIGYLQGNSYASISNSYSSASVTGDISSSAGGLAGSTTDPGYGALISNSYASGQVKGDNAGGLVGLNYGADIQDSHATGAVQSIGIAAGGLVGQNGGNVERSYATGSVVAGTHGYAGGLLGSGGAKIYQDYATGNVTAGDTGSAGGLVGQIGNGDVRYSYAMGSVTVGANGYAGGLVGNLQQGLLSYSYSTGSVSAGAGSMAGGFVGIDYARRDIFRTYWDMDTSGISDPAQGAGSPANDYGIAGLSTAQLQSGLPKGFEKSIWREDSNINNGYPYLRAVKPH